MQTAIAIANTANRTARTAAQAGMKKTPFIKTFTRKWDMIGVIVLMGASTFYAVGNLMTLAR